MVMSKGEPFIFPDEIVRKIMDNELQIVEVTLEKSTVWVNKAHIVSVFLDKDEMEAEYRKKVSEETWNKQNNEENMPPTISIEKIQQLKEKAKQLAINKKL